MIIKELGVLLVCLFFFNDTGTEVFAAEIFGNARVSIDGIGKIKIGMTIKQAEKATGIPLTPAQAIDKVDLYRAGKVPEVGYVKGCL